MISVIVPVYGVEKYIKKCLESIVNQDDADFELILVDDGSKDKSVEIINDYLKDCKINWKIVHKKNGGLASARNAGIEKAKGEYIAFVDSDDCISKDFLRKLKETINKYDADFSFCNFEFVKEQIEPQDNNDELIEFNKESLMKAFMVRNVNFVVPSMMFKKDFLLKNNINFDDKIKFSEDQPFIWSVIFASNKSVYIKKKMYGYYIRENSIMTSSSTDKILTSYREYLLYVDNLNKKYPEYKDTIDKIIPRWSLGALYTSANITDYKNFKHIYKTMEAKSLYKRTRGLNDRNTTILALVSLISPRFLYMACRSVKL